MNDKNMDAEVERAVPATLQAYLELELGTEGSVAQALYSRVGDDAALQEIDLSDIVGPVPANFTPQMRGWYQLRVAPTRDEALKALSLIFSEQEVDEGVHGFLLQSRVAALQDDLLIDKRRCYQLIAERFRTDTDTIAGLDDEIRSDKAKFNTMRAELGREPRILNRPIYWAGLAFILVAESFLNFASFSSLSWATPFIATGSTLIVAACIAFASHLHGTCLKQYEYHFGPAENDTKRYQAWRAIGIGYAALIGSLAFVYYARSAYLAVYLASLGAFGLSGQGHSTIWIIGGSILGNVLVYLAGCLWAYILHDQNPDYPELKVKLDKKEAQRKQLVQKLNSARQRELERLNAKFARDLSAAKTANATFISKPKLKRPLELLASFQAQDGRILGLLQEFRGALLKRLKDANAKPVFIAYNDDPIALKKQWTASEYSQQPLTLKYLEN